MRLTKVVGQAFSFLENRVALVTGSTSGIGLGVARGLAARGCNVILNGFGEDKLISELKQEFDKEYKVKVEHIDADLTKSADVASLCDQALKIHPKGVDVLVNNAGFQHVSPVEDFADEKWDAMVAVMLTAPFQLTKRLLPAMKQNGWGRIVNIASVHGIRASPNKAAYVSCKHGVIGLSKVVALETAGSGVTVNAICPGFVETPILQFQVQNLADKENISYDEAKGKFLASFHPSKAPVGIDHLAETVIYLCSDAASQMTGANMVLDGGWSAK